MSQFEDTDLEDRVYLPGFGSPLAVDSTPFLHALDDYPADLPFTTIREFTMMNLMNQLTDKPDWDKKINNPEIASKWRAEALDTPYIDISEKMIDYCIAELQHKSQLFQQYNAVSVFHGDVVKSDTIVPECLRLALIEAVKPLEDVPQRYQDWHPQSDEKVLDLVHPSLYPLVYGRSRILPSGKTTLGDCIEKCGEGEVPLPPSNFVHYQPRSFSDKFQWLPCEVDVSNGETKITSYINNLHPHKHKDLYTLISQVISHAIPLWNMTLSPQLGEYKRRIQFEDRGYNPDPASWPETEGPQRIPGEAEYEHEERRREWIEQVRRVKQPEPDEFEPYPPELLVDLRKEFAESGLQVIVKLANIVLTPEKPNYEGGTWHIEGQLNEHICATALYYYDNDNATANHLAFRQRVSSEESMDIEMNVQYLQEHEWLSQVFGAQNETPTIQNVGKIETKQGRLLTFPNVLQHQVQPFQLADPTKPGHRKILALFLVDPHVRIISTANVPCQRLDWWKEAAQTGQENNWQTKLPVEIRDQIFSAVEEFPLSMEEAKELRLQLMDERSNYQTNQTEAFTSEHFSLCEH